MELAGSSKGARQEGMRLIFVQRVDLKDDFMPLGSWGG
jgi:hypothetical protein